MTNLILEAINSDEINKINIIKKNKAFLRKLINDLQEVYKIYIWNEDCPDKSIFHICQYSINHNSCLIFTAKDDYCKLYCKLKISKNEYENWRWITEKYNCDTYEDYNIIVEVTIQFTEESENLTDIIKDIIKIINHFEIAKRF